MILELWKSNMDGPRDYHIKWNKSDTEIEISYDIIYMWYLKRWYKWTYLQTSNRLTDFETNLWLPKGKGVGGRDKLEVWD